MADQIVILAPDSTGKKVDTSELTVGANTVERQRVNISDPTTAGAHALVQSAQAAAADNGVVVNPKVIRTATGTKTSVASSASSVTILASNTARFGAVVFNDSTQILYLDLSGGTATTSSYTVQVISNGYFELPLQPLYTGLITGIWASANGNARVTEFT